MMDMTSTQSRLLAALWRQGRRACVPMTLAELSRQVGLSGRVIGGQMRGLVDAGLVRRHAMPNPGRAIVIYEASTRGGQFAADCYEQLNAPPVRAHQ